MAATVLLSLAGLWLATTSLDSPRDWHQPATFPDYVAVPSNLSSVSMTPMLGQMSSMVAVTSPVTVYAVAPNGEIVGRTTMWQTNYHNASPRPRSIREAIRRFFNWAPVRPNPNSQGLMMMGDDSLSLSPMVRVLNDRSESMPASESLLQSSVMTDRYTFR